MSKSRFIDLSSDGGCAKKASCSQLRGLLADVGVRTKTGAFDKLSSELPDIGAYTLPSKECLSTVDILLPMINDPVLFGRIAANHCLNDIYAALGQPQFALAILGVHAELDADSPEIREMMSSATLELKQANVMLIGGHTLANQGDLFLGFAVVGSPLHGQAPPLEPSAGDVICLTKRLGTSVASLRWKVADASIESHSDVVEGMLASNRRASEIATRFGVRYCTDVSGFGLLNNLGALMKRSKRRAELDLSRLRAFDSVANHLAAEEFVTRQFYYNADAALLELGVDSLPQHNRRPLWLDSQICGGLVFICPASQVNALSDTMASEGIVLTKIGVLTEGEGPSVELREVPFE